MPTPRTTWRLLPHDRDAIARLAAALRVAPVVAQLLLNRGLGEAELARRFLDAPMAGLHPPALLPGVEEAADRLFQAVRSGRRVCVYGDYDVDGITATVILWQTLNLLGGTQADYYLPNRLEEGYGLNAEALHQIARTGSSLVVTVDCGVASLAEAVEAKRLGLELLITDHHEPKETLPDAAVVVHPRLPGAAYPFRDLSGSGVAFKLAWALCQKASGGGRVAAHFREFLLDALMLATLGTVADVVPLHDENRIFVRHGLERLRQVRQPTEGPWKGPKLGLKTLLDLFDPEGTAKLDEDTIRFQIAPRLNAAGRLGCARLVVELLTTANPQKAFDLARYLDRQNTDRQTIERRILLQARDQAAEHDAKGAPAFVLAHPEWHKGVIGIVAGRLAEQYHRPALLIASEDDPAMGSGRSVYGFALHEALKACGDQLLSHGGHAAAAGFRIHHAHVEPFRDRFCAYAADRFRDGMPTPCLVLDAEVSLNTLTMGLVESLGRLRPYGAGKLRLERDGSVDNPPPIFLAGGLQIVGEPRRMGKGERHLNFQVRQNGTTLRAVAFGLAERADELMTAGGQCSLAFRPKINEWMGRRTVELDVVDFQAGERTFLS